MTAEQQEPEYIITREQLTQIANLVYPTDYQELTNVFGVIRSRPHSPLQDTTGQKKCVYQGQKDGKLVCAFLMPEPDLYIELTDKIRQDATEKVIDILKQRKSTIKSLYPECGTVMKELGKIRTEEIEGIIESLQKPGVK